MSLFRITRLVKCNPAILGSSIILSNMIFAMYMEVAIEGLYLKFNSFFVH